MAGTSVEKQSWSMERDSEGHRNYKLISQVRADNVNCGPYTVMLTAGLATIGSTWAVGGEVDGWAFCYPDMKITPKLDGEQGAYWQVEQKFSTKPLSRCQTATIENPLLEPQKVSGSFVRYTKEIDRDKDGTKLVYSSHEPITGSIVEFDAHRATVRVEQNVGVLGIYSFTQMMNRVNSSPMWGLNARMVKLSNVSWERKVWGTCTFYYTRAFEFDVDFNTFDREVFDQGRWVLNGEWINGAWVLKNIDGSPPNPNNSLHFIPFRSARGDPGFTHLNGAGLPVTSSNAATRTLQYYLETNFFSLGIPTSF